MVRRWQYATLAIVATSAGLLTGSALAAKKPPRGSAATIGGEVVPMSEVESRMSAELELLRARHEAQVRRFDVQLEKASGALLERTVDQVVDERVLALEAKAAGSTPEALLAKAVPQNAVSDDEVQAFYTANASRLQQPFDAVAGEIRSLLQSRASEPARRAYLDDLRRKHGVRLQFEPERYPVDGGVHARGPAGAPVTIVEFADFQCPYCANFALSVERVLKKHPDRVRHVFRHHPLTGIHPQAFGAAVASACAGEQDGFWRLHYALFADQSRLARDAILDTAGKVSLDVPRLTECLDSGRAKAQVEADVAAVRKLPVEGTPAVFVNGRMYLGTLSYEGLLRLVEEELARAGAVPGERAAAAGP